MNVINRRFRSIDIVKGVSMLTIIAGHYNQISTPNLYIINGLRICIAYLFVASGFDIANLITKKFNNIEDKTTKKNFYISRIKALVPGWILAFAIIYFVNFLFGFIPVDDLAIVDKSSFISKICALLLVHGVIPAANNTVILGGWYIGTLVILYILAPYVYQYLRNAKNRKLFFVITSSIAVFLWLVLYFLFKESFDYNGFGYFLFLNHYPSFCLGIMLYFDMQEKLLKKEIRKIILALAIVASAIAFAFYFADFKGNGMILNWLSSIASYGFFYVVLSNEYEKPVNEKSNFLIKLGNYSYFVYLLHIIYAWGISRIIKYVLNKYLLINPNTYFWYTIVLFIVIALSYYTGIYFSKLVNKVRKAIFK